MPETKLPSQGWFGFYDVELIRDIQREPVSGIGKPEPLQHDFSGYWGVGLPTNNGWLMPWRAIPWTFCNAGITTDDRNRKFMARVDQARKGITLYFPTRSNPLKPCWSRKVLARSRIAAALSKDITSAKNSWATS